MAVITGKDEELLVGGSWVAAESERAVRRDEPGHGRRRRHGAGRVRKRTCSAAIDAAAEALEGWKSLAAIERARILRRSADVIRERKDEIAAVMTAEQGKPLAEAAGEVDYAAGFLEWFGGEAERVYGQVVPAANAANRVLVLRQPVGVVAAITPWNFPAAMMTRKLGPCDGGRLHQHRQARERDAADGRARAARDRGRWAPPGASSTSSPRARPGWSPRRSSPIARVRKISFTGSTEVGKELIRLSARAGEAALARAGRARAVPDLRRRRPRPGRRRADRLQVPQRRPDLRLREPYLCPERRLRRVRRSGSRRR